MQLSVIILNYNVKYFLAACIDSVQNAIKDMDAEIIVADNASNDNSKSFINQHYPTVKYIYLEENFGFPKGNNIAVASAKGEYILILNPDTLVRDNLFKTLIPIYENLKNPGILGCKLIDGGGKFLPESKRGIPTPWVALTKMFNLYKIFPKSSLFNQYYAMHLAEKEVGKVPILVGAFIFMKRKIYNEIGGFDEGCFMYADDIDLSYLSLKHGYQNYYYGHISAVHFKGESTNKDASYMQRFSDAMQFFYRKHFRPNMIFNLFLKWGTKLFALKKKHQVEKITFIPQKYIFISQNYQTLETWKLANNSKKCMHYASIDLLLKANINVDESEIWVDMDAESYKHYLTLLEKYSTKKCTFKCKPKGHHFLIGSYSSDALGEVIHF